MAETRWVSVARLDELPDGEVRVVEVDEVRIALCRVGARVFAIQDLCTHDDGPLGEGSLDGFAIECPRHGARFDVRTGEVLQPPAVTPVRSFPIRLEDGEVRVEVEADEADEA